MKQLYEIDQNGYLVAIHIKNPLELLVDHKIITVDPPNGLYSPRWDEKSKEWVNGLSEEEIEELNSPKKTVDDLKRELSQSDYQIIKCYEYALAGLELPYDVQLLHEERQALRDQINAMEGQ